MGHDQCRLVLFAEVAHVLGYTLHVDLTANLVHKPDGTVFEFVLNVLERERLLGGLDEIELTMLDSALIADYEVARRKTEPWLFDEQG